MLLRFFDCHSRHRFRLLLGYHALFVPSSKRPAACRHSTLAAPVHRIAEKCRGIDYYDGQFRFYSIRFASLELAAETFSLTFFGRRWLHDFAGY